MKIGDARMDGTNVAEAHKTMAVTIAYLSLLESAWEELDDEERRTGLTLALQAARRAAVAVRPPTTK